MKNIGSISFAFLAIILFNYGCKPELNIPDVSAVQLDNQIIRYDQVFNEINEETLQASLTDLAAHHPLFSELYLTKILPLKPSTDEAGFNQTVLDYLNDPDVKRLNDTIELVFANFGKIETEINDALKFYKHYFPNATPPNIYTFTSYFGYQSFIFPDMDRDGIGVGLDMFIGEDYPYKAIDPQNPAFSAYLTHFYQPKAIAKKIIEQIITDKLGQPKGSKLIDHMIHHGKKLYLLKLCLPKSSPALIHDYTDEQMAWCQSNETGIWTYLVDKELLYGTDNTTVNRYTRPAPTSRNMPAESPGRTANFLGLKIVEAYMNQHPETSLDDLIGTRDGTKILQMSKYKPPRI